MWKIALIGVALLLQIGCNGEDNPESDPINQTSPATANASEQQQWPSLLELLREVAPAVQAASGDPSSDLAVAAVRLATNGDATRGEIVSLDRQETADRLVETARWEATLDLRVEPAANGDPLRLFVSDRRYPYETVLDIDANALGAVGAGEAEQRLRSALDNGDALATACVVQPSVGSAAEPSLVPLSRMLWIAGPPDEISIEPNADEAGQYVARIATPTVEIVFTRPPLRLASIQMVQHGSN